MNADAFRHLYEYHFTANRKIWDRGVMALSDAQFTQKVEYSVGSVRNQVVHMLNIDDRWFCGLRSVTIPGFLNPVYYARRAVIREKWDDVEATMRAYLADLSDDKLDSQPFLTIDNDPIRLWQVLLHVVNHGTDHRAQLLALLHALGVKTFAQDYAYFIEGRL